MNYIFSLLSDYFKDGGTLMYYIFGVSVVSSFIIVNKHLYLSKFEKARQTYLNYFSGLKNNQAKNLDVQTGIPEFDQLIAHIKKRSDNTCGCCSSYLFFREFLISSVPQLDKGLSTLSVWISVAPLLGLLGTVGGMIETFKVITDYGLGNPNLTAEGISIALITTQAGLTVAFPMVLFHNQIANRAKKIKNSLFVDGEELVNYFNQGCTGDNTNV